MKQHVHSNGCCMTFDAGMLAPASLRCNCRLRLLFCCACSAALPVSAVPALPHFPCQMCCSASCSVHAVPSCQVDVMPDLPRNTAWTSDNGCNAKGATVAQGAVCSADCQPGYIKTGSALSYVCSVDGTTTLWTTISTGLTCTGESCLCGASFALEHV
jgi:hypothetical protein